MSRENNFENAQPVQIVDLIKSFLRIGAYAHQGASGRYYGVNDEVVEGELEGPVRWDFDVTKCTHIHTDMICYHTKDGVDVKIEGEIDDLGDMH